MNDGEPGNVDLVHWRASRPSCYYTATPNLAAVLALHLGRERLAALDEHLREVGWTVAEEVEPRVAALEAARGYPRLVPRDAIGRPREYVEFHPAYHEIGERVQAFGIAAAASEPGRLFEAAAGSYLLGFAGEGGHACPLACTAGLLRALTRHGSQALRDRFVPPLVETDYRRCQRGAQLLTEIQGGSDVGAGTVAARPDRELAGAYRISGEKWFCSVADADQMALTARVPGGASGTAGLGCFLVPRRIDGVPNGFHVHRLKDKLGSRCMATAEIGFAGALGWPIGAVEQGFRIAVEELLDTSRWCNALACAGLMRRAWLEASSYARHRHAFGRPIVSYPAVARLLASMAAEEMAALASTLELTGLRERLDLGRGDGDDDACYRVLVNANKFVTAVAATRVAHGGIEVLGGNGTIEDFSPLPRLYRDAMVFESWEGAHNVLCAQVRRDLQRGRLEPVLRRIRALVPATGTGEPLHREAGHLEVALQNLAPRLARSLDDDAFGTRHFRHQLEELVRCWQVACMLREAEHAAEYDTAAAGRKVAAAGQLFRDSLWRSYDAEMDSTADERIAVLATGRDRS